MARKVKKTELGDKGVTLHFDDDTQSFSQFTDKSLGSNFQYLKNPTTNKFLGVGKDLFGEAGNDLANVGFAPVAEKDLIPPDLDVFNNKNQNIVGGSDKVRSDEENGKADLNKAAGELDSMLSDNDIFDFGTDFGNEEFTSLRDDVTKQTDEIKKLVAAERILSTDDLSEIDKAGDSAGAEFDPIIAEAVESRRQGLPRALISAGEKGGFMSTQLAGVAALTQTEGGTFFGVGGQLEKIKSSYDAIISKLKVQKEQATISAKQAAKKAIETNKKEDTDRAMQLFDIARQNYQDAVNAVQQKVDLVTQLDSVKESRARFEREKVEWGIADDDRETEIANADELKTNLWNDYENELSITGYKKLNPAEVDKGTRLREEDIVRLKNPITGTDDIWSRPDGSSDDAQLVRKWLEQYPDSKITPDDDLQTARAKLVESPLFRKNNKLGGTGGTGGGSNTTKDDFKFTNSQKQELDRAGMGSSDANIQNDFLGLVPSERDKFIRDFGTEQKSRSISSDSFYGEWLDKRIDEIIQEENEKENKKGKFDELNDDDFKANQLDKYIEEDEEGQFYDVSKMPLQVYEEAKKRGIF